MCAPNIPAHRPRASDAKNTTETLSRGSVKPAGWAWVLVICLPDNREIISPAILENGNNETRVVRRGLAPGVSSTIKPEIQMKRFSGSATSAAPKPEGSVRIAQLNHYPDILQVAP